MPHGLEQPEEESVLGILSALTSDQKPAMLYTFACGIAPLVFNPEQRLIWSLLQSSVWEGSQGSFMYRCDCHQTGGRGGHLSEKPLGKIFTDWTFAEVCQLLD